MNILTDLYKSNTLLAVTTYQCTRESGQVLWAFIEFLHAFVFRSRHVPFDTRGRDALKTNFLYCLLLKMALALAAHQVQRLPIITKFFVFKWAKQETGD